MPWLKTDIDTDGYTDLLVLIKDTMIKKEPQGRLLALIEEIGDNSPYLKGEYEVSDSTISYHTSIQGRPAIFFYHFDKDILKNTGDTVFYELPEERLVLMDGEFIEYNGSPQTYNIDSISYKIISTYSGWPVFTMTIHKNRKVWYEAIEYNWDDNHKDRRGKFTGTITEVKIREILELLNYINFPSLEDNYSAGTSDLAAGTLTVSYNNGKTKTIEDYGFVGTKGLHALHQLIFALRFNQNWH